MTETPHIADVPPVKRTRKRKAVAAKPRVIDPGIAALRAEHAAKVNEYRKTDASKRLLRTILEKRLSQLTTADREKLFDALKLNTTPPLIPN